MCPSIGASGRLGLWRPRRWKQWGPLESPQKGLATRDLTSTAPRNREYRRLMQDFGVGGRCFPAVAPPPSGQRYPVAPVNLDVTAG